jgi:putative ABC transport system substrate-binding protein
MRRREFIAGVGVAAATLVVRAQQQPNTPTIGVLIAANPEPFWTLFREGMRDLGYSEGRNVRFDFRSADGKIDLLSDLAAQLVHNNVDAIVACLTPAVAAAKQATREIPIVMAGAGDPVATGFISSSKKRPPKSAVLSTCCQVLSRVGMNCMNNVQHACSR